MTAWDILEIEPDSGERAIKRAYALRLKATRPEDDPQAFQALRQAYEHALSLTGDADAIVPIAGQVSQERTEDIAAITGATAYERTRDGAPQPNAPEQPEAQAQRIWDAFARGRLDTLSCIDRLVASGELLDLQVRDCFELCALRHCAQAQCDDKLREQIAKFFEWDRGDSPAQRELPEQARETMNRLYAYRSHYWLFSHQDDPAVAALLATAPPSNFRATFDRDFTESMRHWTKVIRWGHKNMLAYKLDLQVFEAWEKAVSERRYFKQTATMSLYWGVALFVVIGLCVYLTGWDPSELAMMITFVAVEAATCGAIAWWHLRPPAFLQSERLRQWREWLREVWLDHRHRPAWQFGWLPVYVAGTLLLAVPAPSAVLAFVTGATLLGTALAATFANSTRLTEAGFAIHGLLAFLFGAGLHTNIFRDHSMATTILAVFCSLQVLFRGGGDILTWLGYGPEKRPFARLIWLTGATMLLMTAFSTRTPSLNLQIWLWVLGGFVLTRSSEATSGIFFISLMVMGVARRVVPDIPLHDNLTFIMATLLFALGINMAVNRKEPVALSGQAG